MTDATPHATPRFGESGAPATTPGFGAPGIVVGVVAILAVIGGLLWSAVVGNATPATHPHLLGGSIVLEDNRPLTVINRATGQPTVQLQDVNQQVGASNYAAVQAVPLSDGTMLVNTITGAFNLLQPDNYVADTAGAGVGLGTLPGSTSAAGYADGTDAFIVRSGPRSTVSLVDGATVSTAAAAAAAASSKAPTSIPPVGFASLAGRVPTAAGATVVAGSTLWTLDATGTGCSLMSISRAVGAALSTRVRAKLSTCSDAAVGSAGSTVGLAIPGHVTLYRGGHSIGVDIDATVGATAILPVTGSSSTLWYLADEPSGWEIFGVGADGTVDTPRPLRGVSTSTDPAPPVLSDGRIYTLDRRASARPALWVIDPTSGTVGALKGVSTYPVASATEQEAFSDADVLVSGPRVVYNNPGSILAVVVFTDGSHAPVVVNKSSAVAVAPTGPAEVNTPPQGKSAPKRTRSPTSTVPTPKLASPPAVSPTVTCANTTEKPYAPTDVAVTPAAESAQVTWSYNLLTDQDCQPRTWSVRVTALSGAQPKQPVQYINDQQQLDFVGLRPSTRYDAVVTAFINKQTTASAATSFTTGAQGADAPTSVHATVDGAGNWVVSWAPCRSSTCYTPAAQWIVTSTACGGSYAGVPPSMAVAGSKTTVTFDAAQLNRLGQSLSFGVQGVSAANRRGNVTSDPACLQSWRPPQRAGVSLTSSGTTSALAVTATLAVAPGTSDVDVYGSASTELQYKLNGIDQGAPTTATRVVIRGLAPNFRYRPSVVIWPLGHPSASITVSGPVVKQDLTWNPNLAVKGDVTVDASNPNAGIVTAVFSGLGAGSFNTSGTLSCGSSTYTFDHLAVTDGVAQLTDALDLDRTTSCTGLSVTVYDTAKPDPYGTPSPSIIATSIGSLPAAPTYSFSASYVQHCRPRAPTPRCITLVTVLSPNQSGQTLAGADWQITATQEEQCGKTTSYPSQPPARAVLRLTDCPFTNPATGIPLTVTVTWLYGGQPQQATVLKPTGTSGTTTTTSTTSSTTSTTRPTTTTSTSSTTPPRTTTTPSTTSPVTAPPTTGPPTTGPPTTGPPTTGPPTTGPPTTGPPTTGGPPTSAAAISAADASRASSTTSPTASAALVAARVSPGGPGTDGAGELSLELLVGTLIAAMAAVGLLTRLRRRRDLLEKGNP